jgi:hypothetical protein
MGEWKAPLSLRIRQEFRRELEEVAARDRRTLGNVSELLLEWAYDQLKIAGSLERLLNARLAQTKGPR